MTKVSQFLKSPCKGIIEAVGNSGPVSASRGYSTKEQWLPTAYTLFASPDPNDVVLSYDPSNNQACKTELANSRNWPITMYRTTGLANFAGFCQFDDFYETDDSCDTFFAVLVHFSVVWSVL
jgi:hypothetical protein